MGKKAVTWMDVIREQLAKMRKEGKSPSIGDVTPYAKKEWAEIKAGKHPLYMQGTSKGTNKGTNKGKGTSKGKKNKTQKIMKGNKNIASNTAIQQMLSKVHLCKKCTTKIQKYLKTQKGGNCGCGQSGGGEGCGCDQSGGKRKTRKMKKMKGGDDMKETYVDFPGKDGLEELDEETDGTQLDIQRVEDV
jgi:Tfp pilus assembly protein PilV